MIELVPAIDSVLICFDPLATTSGTLWRAVTALLSSPQTTSEPDRRIVEIELDDAARKNFDVSVDAVKELLVACKQIDSSLG